MNKVVAEISIDLKARRVINVEHHGGQLTFKCQRCAVFCCRLGAPRLMQRDIESLEREGYGSPDFLDNDHTRLKSKEDGSCIFLSSRMVHGSYRCSVYNSRPVLCRLYPFEFEKSRPNLYALKLIPCCRGLNTMKGEAVDTRFAVKIANSCLFELIDAGLV